MMKRIIDAVIFDLDGTLIDSMGIWTQVDVEFLEKRGIAVPDNLFKDMEDGNSFYEVAIYFKAKFGLPETPEEIIAEWTDMVAHHYKHDVGLKPGALELLALLDDNDIRMSVGTSNSKFLAETVLKANGILNFFDVIIAGEGDLRGKPFPDIFLAAANHMNVEPERCLVFEDVHAGVLAAINAGMKVFAVRDDYSKSEWELLERDAHKIADHLGHLIIPTGKLIAFE